MFDIGWTELLTIAAVAIVVIGPKDLPRAMRTVGQWTSRMRRMARDFQGQFNEALREAELDGVRKDVEAIAKINPLADMKKEMAKAGEDFKKIGNEIKGSLDAKATSASGAPAADMASPASDAAKVEAPKPAAVEAKPVETVGADDTASRTIAAPEPAAKPTTSAGADDTGVKTISQSPPPSKPAETPAPAPVEAKPAGEPAPAEAKP